MVFPEKAAVSPGSGQSPGSASGSEGQQLKQPNIWASPKSWRNQMTQDQLQSAALTSQHQLITIAFSLCTVAGC